ncbi:protein of unknown function [Candidatus Nitrosocosmicus franklandus]|uniref:Uncharacterized protein n=1 Tax=Candidatus Nitrosocosmicus franklandianus TaxID=1798806 RepID=A0A484IFH2_9ARCH|nr:protein of unknown function [Candidatus Nitrosocosmicus franklandus]
MYIIHVWSNLHLNTQPKDTHEAFKLGNKFNYFVASTTCIDILHLLNKGGA